MDKELARSACNVFGHQWTEPKYRALVGPSPDYMGSKLVITRVRTCRRCGKVEHAGR